MIYLNIIDFKTRRGPILEKSTIPVSLFMLSVLHPNSGPQILKLNMKKKLTKFTSVKLQKRK